MSKIYDALRKAEREKGRGGHEPKARRRKKSKPAGSAKPAVTGFDDQFRRSVLNLRNSIDSEMKQNRSKIILFTSSVEAEGKTSVLSTLARIIALGETDRVLLVDCAVENPELHSLFGVKNEKGILNYLAEEIELPQAIRSVDEGILDLVTLGESKVMDVTQPLFSSERMGLFCTAARDHYDYVLIDSSPVLSVPDTSIIGSFVDGVVLVIHSGTTKREVIKRAIQRVEKMDGKFIGTVLNRKKYYIPEFIYKRV